jgi:hypothetical protein
MNATVRNEFKQTSGFDPIELFDKASGNYWKTNPTNWRKFADYRKDLSYRIKEEFLSFLCEIKNQKSGFDVMLTGIDVSLQPAESDNIGETTENTLALYQKYDISLQIEDPSNCWGSEPERYAKLGELYRKTVKDENRLVFDCNVVGSHEHGYGGFPSEMPSGEEVRQIAYNMSLNNIRPAFYSEDALNANDYKNISTVFAHNALVNEVTSNKWAINTPYTIMLNIGRENLQYKLDNKPWYASNSNMVIIPKGNHTLEFDTLSQSLNTISLKSITGELMWAKFSNQKLNFEYNEELTSCYVILDKKPARVYVDNKITDCLYVNNNEFILKLPKGKHKVQIDC